MVKHLYKLINNFTSRGKYYDMLKTLYLKNNYEVIHL